MIRRLQRACSASSSVAGHDPSSRQWFSELSATPLYHASTITRMWRGGSRAMSLSQLSGR